MMDYDTMIARMQTADIVCRTKYDKQSKVILQPVVSFDGHQDPAYVFTK